MSNVVRPLRVLVDMDGVLCDFEPHLLNEFRRLFPDDPFVKLSERRTFYMSEQYELLRPGLADKLEKIMRTQGFFRTLPPIEGAIDAVKEMVTIPGVEVFLCTSPLDEPYYCVQEKLEWVKQYFGKNFMRRVIITRDKTLVHGDLLIDDKHTITGSLESPSWKHIIFSQNHNMHLKSGSDGVNFICRLDNWTDRYWYKVIGDFLARLRTTNMHDN